MSRENENPLEALVRDFYKGIEVKLQAKTGWGRNEVLEVVRDVQVEVLAKHLARATAQLHPQVFEAHQPVVFKIGETTGRRLGVESEDPPWKPKRRPVEIGRGAIYMLDTYDPAVPVASDDQEGQPWDED